MGEFALVKHAELLESHKFGDGEGFFRSGAVSALV